METLVTHRQSSGTDATVRVDPEERSEHAVNPNLFAKFGEHLYMVGMDEEFNAKNAFEAQILHNPTFGAWKFQVHGNAVDGGRPSTHDSDVISERIEGYADVHDLPDPGRMEDAYFDGTALWWFPYGDADIRTSPDVGTARDRAQRLEVANPDGRAGLAQWCYLPLHRTTGYEGKITVRATEPTSIEIAIHRVMDDGTIGDRLDSASVSVGTELETAAFDLDLPDDADDSADALYACSVTTGESANLVVDRVLLYPDDHVHTADPELVEILSEADLPLLRWPGGNFVSGYRWEDGVGPIEERPTKPNPAWDGLESNLFGTHEFVEFCEAVGCEPMICLNAGDGTPEEAARWVEYCNGDPEETEMGALRAEHGHPEPYNIEYWEIGNELFGEWQVSWTTPEGNADRFERFVDAMEAVDDSIEVLACGNRITDWNDPLFETAPEKIDYVTDHVLVGGEVRPDVDTAELFNGYMGLAEQVMDEYEVDEAKMREHGVPDPKVSITELQFFSFLDPRDPDVEIPTSQSISEALYSATFVHAAIRTEGLVEMITHSGIGNHGGGIQKHKERVWAHPCQYYHGMGSALFDGTPLEIDLECDTYSTETTFAPDASKWTGPLPPADDAPVVDPMAVLTPDEDELVVDLIHRDVTAGALDASVEVGPGFEAADEAELTVLSGESIRDENTFEEPENVTPSTETVAVEDGTAEIELPPLTIARVTFERA